MDESSALGSIVPGMPVYGASDEPIGPVEGIDATGIRVLNHTVPAAAISRVAPDGVHLLLGYAAFTTRGSEAEAAAGIPRGVVEERPVERLTVPVAEERLVVGTRETQLGEARVTKRVVEEQVMVPVTIRREEIEVIRRAPGEPREEIDDPTVVEVIRIPLRGEEPVIAKEAVVTSEVVIGRTVRTERREVTGTVRSTELAVDERVGAAYDRLRPDFEGDFARRQGQAAGASALIVNARNFRDAEPNYRAGFLAGRDPRYAGRTFEEIEPELRHATAPPRDDPSLLARIREEVREGFVRARAEHPA